jgi:hypothetical protein
MAGKNPAIALPQFQLKKIRPFGKIWTYRERWIVSTR